jgi:hypothetical protein
MKARFFLALLAFNGLIFAANSASAFTRSSTDNRHDAADLSRSISQLVNLTPDTYSLIEMAIDRALLAQAANDNPVPLPPVTAGVPAPNQVKDPQPQPIVNGKIANPNPPKTKPRVRPISKRPKPIPEQKVKNISVTAPQAPQLCTEKPTPTPSSTQTDRPPSKKLSECQAPLSNNTNSAPTPALNSTPASSSATPVPQVRHWIGARG